MASPCPTNSSRRHTESANPYFAARGSFRRLRVETAGVPHRPPSPLSQVLNSWAIGLITVPNLANDSPRHGYPPPSLPRWPAGLPSLTFLVGVPCYPTPGSAHPRPFTGMDTLKTLPRPTSLSTSTCPPCSSMICLLIARPRPELFLASYRDLSTL